VAYYAGDFRLVHRFTELIIFRDDVDEINVTSDLIFKVVNHIPSMLIEDLAVEYWGSEGEAIFSKFVEAVDAANEILEMDWRSYCGNLKLMLIIDFPLILIL
jgi:hypothetical protein